jgi:hypothetical protein
MRFLCVQPNQEIILFDASELYLDCVSRRSREQQYSLVLSQIKKKTLVLCLYKEDVTLLHSPKLIPLFTSRHVMPHLCE